MKYGWLHLGVLFLWKCFNRPTIGSFTNQESCRSFQFKKLWNTETCTVRLQYELKGTNAKKLGHSCDMDTTNIMCIFVFCVAICVYIGRYTHVIYNAQIWIRDKNMTCTCIKNTIIIKLYLPYKYDMYMWKVYNIIKLYLHVCALMLIF